MNTSSPTEYISLKNTKLLDNFSEIFPKRLLVPNKCPDIFPSEAEFVIDFFGIF